MHLFFTGLVAASLYCWGGAALEQEPPRLEGLWVRTTEVSSGSRSGLSVLVSGSQALVVQAPEGSCFPVGDLKWKSLRSDGTGYVVEELWRYNSTCESAGYTVTKIRFTSEDEIELSADGVRTRWVRWQPVEL